MTEPTQIRQQIALARDRLNGALLALAEAEASIRAKDERRLRIYVAAFAAEAIQAKNCGGRMCDALNRMPLDGLLQRSLAAVAGGQSRASGKPGARKG